MAVEFFVLLIFPNQFDQKMVDVLFPLHLQIHYLNVHLDFFLITKIQHENQIFSFLFQQTCSIKCLARSETFPMKRSERFNILSYISLTSRE
jgi:hypothetical protein